MPAYALTLRDRVHDVAPLAGTQEQWLALPEGGERSYLLHRPTAAVLPRSSYPLVVVLHGFGSSPAQQERLSGFSALADQAGFVVAYPRGVGLQWNFDGKNRQDKQDEQFIRAVVADVARQTSIDERRVYLAGLSNGAQMAARLACVATDLLAAVVLVAGNYQPYEDCQRGGVMPTLLFHGTNDRILPYNGRWQQFSPQYWAEQQARRNGCADKPILIFRQAGTTAQAWRECMADVVFYTLGGGGHGWPSLATRPDIDATALSWQFFVQHPPLQALAHQPGRR